MVVVDTRPLADFHAGRIPGSIHLPAHAIKATHYFRNKAVLLVNAGFGGQALEALCEQLRRLGFREVAVLDGGVNYWARHVGRLEGDRPVVARIASIAPRDFLAERSSCESLVVDISGSGPEPAAPATLALRPDELSGRLAQHLEQNESPRLIVFTNGDGAYAPSLYRQAQALPVPAVFFLEGGIEAYRNFAEQQQLMASRAAEPAETEPCRR